MHTKKVNDSLCDRKFNVFALCTVFCLNLVCLNFKNLQKTV